MSIPQEVYDVAFHNTKAHVMQMIQQLVPPWAQSMVNITDAEIRAISSPAATAVVQAYLKATAAPAANTP